MHTGPSGLKHTLLTSSECPSSVRTGAPVARDGTRRGDPLGRRPGRRGSHQRDRPALDEEAARLPGEVTDVVVAILQGDALGAPAHDLSAEVAGSVLDEHAHLDDDVGVGRTTLGRREVVEDVTGVRHGPSEAVDEAAVPACSDAEL